MRRFLEPRSSKPPNSRPSEGEDLALMGHPLIVASFVVGSRWAALAVSALLITACGGGSASTTPVAKKASTSASKAKATPTRAPNDTAQLIKLVSARAHALEIGDAEDYAATATGNQVAKDRRAATNASE